MFMALRYLVKKINHFVKFETLHLKSNKSERGQAEIKIKFETNLLLQKISADDYILLFDENGAKMDSLSFSKSIDKAQQSGKKRGVLIIGGAYGIGDQIQKKANQVVNLSMLTMNHLVAETVVLEQFYRAQTILNRIPYHNI